jgi:hypothetical protein
MDRKRLPEVRASAVFQINPLSKLWEIDLGYRLGGTTEHLQPSLQTLYRH